jgi:outer membrane protein assembly factor BamB
MGDANVKRLFLLVLLIPACAPAPFDLPKPAAVPDKLEILWQFSTKDTIQGAPAINKDVVYIGSMDGNLYAIDLVTGQEKWKCDAGRIEAPPSYRDGVIYVGDADGVFHGIAAADGKKLWKYETGNEISSGANFFGDLILFGSHDESLYCLTKDGKEKWTFKTQGPVYGTPAIVDGKVFVAGCDSSLHVVDAAKGTELSSVDLGGQAAAGATVAGDILYVGTMSNQFHAVDWKKGKIEWTFEREDDGQAFYSSAAVSDKLVIAGSRDRRVYALDRQTGKEVWHFATRGHIDSSPVIVGNRIYVGSLDKNFYVLDLAEGKELQKIELDSAVTGSPAFVDGRLLIGTEKGTLYCLGAKK